MRKPHTATALATALLCWPAMSLPAPCAAQTPPAAASYANPRAELDTGTRLTRVGLLQQAIPHLLAAQKAGLEPYATAVNLGICYLGTNQYARAIATLEALRNSPSRFGPGSANDTPTVDNLLAQAYLGENQPKPAFAAFLRAAAATPKSERLYAFMADACTDHEDYALGLRIVDMGLHQLPDSARLHYERAVFLSRLDRFEEAKPDFDEAAKLAPTGYIGVLAVVQKDLYQDNLTDAIRLLRQAVRAGHRDYQTLSLLGSVLLFEGALPGQPEFAEAQSALEQSVSERPDYPSSQIALGKLYLREDRYADAAAHLEVGRHLEPNDPAVYASLANAYRRLGENDKASEANAQMARLLAQQKATSDAPHP